MSQCSLRAAQRAGSSLRPQCRGSTSSSSTRGTAVRVLASAAPAEAAGSKGRVFVTGSNTGIGLETARSLCRQGYAVTIACRDQAKMDAAAAAIRQSVPGAAIDGQLLDLASLASVRDCAARVLDSGVAYDVWLNNAGVMACPKMATRDGFEYQLGVNHLGHFLLTTEVLPALQASGKPVRLITVASAAHQFGRIDFGDLMRDAPGAYQPWDAYGQSKLANILFTYELVRRLGADTNIVANCLHPGVVRTELGRYMVDSSNSWYMAPAIAVAQLLFKTPEQGAQTSIYLASDPAAGAVTGKYFTDCKPATSSPASYDAAVAAKLWEVSQELVHSSKATGKGVPAAKGAPANVAV